MTSPSPLRPETMAVVAGRPREPGQPLNHPILAASNYRFDPLGSANARQYARGDSTPTVRALEEAVAALEGGPTIAFSSGMAAIGAIFDLVPPGATIIAPDDCYQGVASVLEEGRRRLGWTVKRLPGPATDRWVSELEKQPDLLWLESPSNPLLLTSDIATILAAARERKVLSAVDNTFATPLLQLPLTLGASVSVHSTTKFIGGHSDLLGGLVSVAPGPSGSGSVLDRLRQRQQLGGAVPGALETYLALRGLRTLPVRLGQGQRSAQDLAHRLSGHPAVKSVHYPGLTGAEGPNRTSAGPGQFGSNGFGAMLSFETVGTAAELDQALAQLSVVVTATSLGGVESTIERRARLVGQQHLPETLLRLSVGCEHIDDLWNDLAQMLARLG